MFARQQFRSQCVANLFCNRMSNHRCTHQTTLLLVNTQQRAIANQTMHSGQIVSWIQSDASVAFFTVGWGERGAAHLFSKTELQSFYPHKSLFKN